MTASADMAGPSPLAILRRPSFTGLWSAQLLSACSNTLTNVLAGIVVFRLTGSALSMGLVMAASAVATLVVGILAGVMVDRVDPKRAIVSSSLFRAALVVAVPLLLSVHVAFLFVLVALATGLRQFVPPAGDTLLPELVREEETAAATSLMGSGTMSGAALGAAAAGVLGSWVAVRSAFFIDGGILVAAALAMSPVGSKPRPAAPRGGGLAVVAANLREGLATCTGTPLLRSMLVVSSVRALSYGLWVAALLPFTVRVLHAPDVVYGLQAGLTTMGFALGSVALAWVAHRFREGQWVVVALTAMGILAAAYSVVSSIWAALVLVAAIAIVRPPFHYARRTIVRRSVPPGLRGRVSSTFYVSWSTLYMVGMAAVGLADVVPVRWLLFGSAAATLVAGMASAVVPGLGLPRAEWRRAVRLLRGAPAAPGLRNTRPASPDDLEELARHVGTLQRLTPEARRQLAARALVADAPAGTTILRRGDASDAAYFLLEGRAVAGWDEDGGYRPLETLESGDFFGEIAALRGVSRTAHVVAERHTRLLQLPAEELREMADDPAFKALLLEKERERVSRMGLADMPDFLLGGGHALREMWSRNPSNDA